MKGTRRCMKIILMVFIRKKILFGANEQLLVQNVVCSRLWVLFKNCFLILCNQRGQGTLNIERRKKIHENLINDFLMNMIVGKMVHFVPRMKYRHSCGYILNGRKLSALLFTLMSYYGLRKIELSCYQMGIPLV